MQPLAMSSVNMSNLKSQPSLSIFASCKVVNTVWVEIIQCNTEYPFLTLYILHLLRVVVSHLNT